MAALMAPSGRSAPECHTGKLCQEPTFAVADRTSDLGSQADTNRELLERQLAAFASRNPPFRSARKVVIAVPAAGVDHPTTGMVTLRPYLGRSKVTSFDQLSCGSHQSANLRGRSLQLGDHSGQLLPIPRLGSDSLTTDVLHDHPDAKAEGGDELVVSHAPNSPVGPTQVHLQLCRSASVSQEVALLLNFASTCAQC